MSDIDPAALGQPHQYEMPKDKPTPYERNPGEELIEIMFTRDGSRQGVLMAITTEELVAYAGSPDELRNYRFTQALSMFCKTTGLKVYGQ